MSGREDFSPEKHAGLKERQAGGRHTSDPPSAMSLLQVVYVSSAVQPMDAQALEQLAQDIARRNRSQNIGGLLMHHEGSFVQALEGPDEAVTAAFRRIRKDPRHRGVHVLLWDQVSEREYGHWHTDLVDSHDLPAELQRAIAPVVTPSVGIEDALLVSGRAHRLMQSCVRIAS